jgi:membrane protein required for colicin V production
MNLVDLLVVGIVAISALLGLSRGFVRELLGVGSWIVAGYGAYRFGPAAVPLEMKLLGNADVAEPAAYVTVFVLLLILLSLLSNLVGRVVSGSALGGLDRTLGLVFGLARGAVVVMAAYIPLALMLPPDKWPQAALTARSLPYVYEGAVWLAGLLPEQYRPRVAPPPGGHPTTETDLLHATPQGSALGPSPPAPKLP